MLFFAGLLRLMLEQQKLYTAFLYPLLNCEMVWGLVILTIPLLYSHASLHNVSLLAPFQELLVYEETCSESALAVTKTIPQNKHKLDLE